MGKSTLINALASMATITSPRKVFALPKKEEKRDKSGNIANDGIEISSFTLDKYANFFFSFRFIVERLLVGLSLRACCYVVDLTFLIILM